MNIPKSGNPRLLIIGGGFAGMELARRLIGKPYQVVLLDKNNYFTFQPLMYQVATAGLEPNSIAYPFRRMFRKAENVFYRMAEVEEIRPNRKEVSTSIGAIRYDKLVIATGSKPNYFGLDPDKLMTLKSMQDAFKMRNHILEEFEKALEVPGARNKEALVNIVIVGGGPTGVELAGAFGEMKRYILPKDYPQLDLDKMNIYLLEGMDRLLPPMSGQASAKAQEYLENLGVKVRLNTLVKEYDGDEVEIDGQIVPTRNLIWTAGVQANHPEGLDHDVELKNNRLVVDRMSRILGYNDIFAIGDCAAMLTDKYSKGHPMLAPVAIQQGKQLAKNLLLQKDGKRLKPFSYNDKGSMATVGRNRAVADLPGWKTQGFIAWSAWMFVHLLQLVGFRNKLITLTNWVYNYFTYDRELRIILKTEENTRVKELSE